ncbi:hypothetical protein [Morganella psychrotolerans]|uniref:hypothetical protein n=1 Tax=Morganella psychrotolerans TaxID=368603 RepID=UPI0039B04F4C
MKWLGRTVFRLIILAIVLIIAAGILIQTSWGTRQLAALISDNTRYKVSLSAIDHSLSSPSLLSLRDISINTVSGDMALDAANIELTLDWRSFTEPGWFSRIIIQKGEIEISTAADSRTLPVSAGLLQLNQVNVRRTDGNQNITAEGVTGGITPWQPQDSAITGDGKYQFSAKGLDYYGLPLKNILAQGNISGAQFTFDNLTATLENGLITATGQRTAEGRWLLDNLLLNDIRWQTPLSLAQLTENSGHLPDIQIKNITATNIKLEGDQWAVNYLEGTLKNLAYGQGAWQTDNGLADFGIADLTFGGQHFSDILGTLEFTGDHIAVKRLSGRYDKSILRFTGDWNRTSRTLDISSGVVDNLLFSLPEQWFTLLQESAPQGIDTIRVQDLKVSNALLIDTHPAFPFQMTNVNSYIKTMQILKSGQWGLWNGELSASAGSATFARVELHRPYLTLTAGETGAETTQFSASAGDGLLKMQFQITPSGTAPFIFNLQATSADSQILSQWGWASAPLNGNANYTLRLSGQLRTDDVRNTLSGSLSGQDKQGNQINRAITQGQISNSPAPAENTPSAPPVQRVIPDAPENSDIL